MFDIRKEDCEICSKCALNDGTDQWQTECLKCPVPVGKMVVEGWKNSFDFETRKKKKSELAESVRAMMVEFGKTCCNCQHCITEKGYFYCDIDFHYIGASKVMEGRAEWCPLIEKEDE